MSLVGVAYGSISGCTSCSGLVKVDRPVIESPGACDTRPLIEYML